MAFDSIPVIEDIPEAKFVSVPGALDYGLILYGNYLVQAQAGEAPDAYDSELPWVSASSDLQSPEWDRARKVRQALSIAIDRETIIDTVLRGYARPIALRFWGNHEYQLEGRMWEYNPDRARELLAEAGYPDGFRITFTPALRAAPAEVEACEAISTMWGDIGIDVNFQRIPYETLRPQIVGKTYAGATCHAAGSRVVTVGAQPQLTTQASFNHGATHPWLEEIMPRIAGSVDPKELEQREGELGKFLFDNALTNIGLYQVDVVWPVGPRIEEWREHVKTRDMRNINGYEFIRPR
jgi:ABC-type transport system substrate-binding protein